MAKLNSKNFKLLAKLVHPKTGLAIAIRSDGRILRKNWVSGQYKRWKRLKEGYDPHKFIEDLKAQGWIEGTAPTWQTVQRWASQGKARTPCGCWVEPDGECQHGNKSWLVLLGMI